MAISRVIFTFKDIGQDSVDIYAKTPELEGRHFTEEELTPAERLTLVAICDLIENLGLDKISLKDEYSA